jgi:hypothetical protein
LRLHSQAGQRRFSLLSGVSSQKIKVQQILRAPCCLFVPDQRIVGDDGNFQALEISRTVIVKGLFERDARNLCQDTVWSKPHLVHDARIGEILDREVQKRGAELAESGVGTRSVLERRLDEQIQIPCGSWFRVEADGMGSYQKEPNFMGDERAQQIEGVPIHPVSFRLARTRAAIAPRPSPGVSMARHRPKTPGRRCHPSPGA